MSQNGQTHFQNYTFKGVKLHSPSAINWETSSESSKITQWYFHSIVNIFVAKALITSSILFQIWISHRPGWERRAIALTWPHSRHNKNTNVVCRTFKTLNSTLSRFFLIHSFSTLSIIFFTITLCKWTVWLYSTFYLVLFFHIFTFGFHVAFTC